MSKAEPNMEPSFLLLSILAIMLSLKALYKNSITDSQAIMLFKSDLAPFEQKVKSLVNVPLSQKQNLNLLTTIGLVATLGALQ